MADYDLYAESCNVNRANLTAAINTKYPYFTKVQMSLACNPQRNALQLIPAAEELLIAAFGPGPGLSISPIITKRRNHDNKNKPNRLSVRLDNSLRSRVQNVYDRMCFNSMQDLIEAALAEFCDKYERAS